MITRQTVSLAGRHALITILLSGVNGITMGLPPVEPGPPPITQAGDSSESDPPAAEAQFEMLARAWAYEPAPATQGAGATREPTSSSNSLNATQPYAYPISLGTAMPRLSYDGRAVPSVDTTRVAYESGLGTYAVAALYGEPLSDDLSIEAADGCALAYYEFDVTGRVQPDRPGGPYHVSFQLFTQCASEWPFGLGPLAGTSGAVHVADDRPTTITFVVPAGDLVRLPANLWLSATFSRDNAGMIGGAPPTVGHSTPGFGHPWNGCQSGMRSIDREPIYSHLNARLYVRNDCPSAHLAFANTRAGYSSTASNTGGLWRVERMLLDGGACRMSAYEFNIWEPGWFETELRASCDGPAIAGTRRSKYLVGSASGRVRQVFEPGIDVPAETWFAVRTPIEGSGTIGFSFARPAVGHSPEAAAQHAPGSACEPGLDEGRLSVSVSCEGPAPLGACCDMHMKQCVGGANEGGRCRSDEHCPDGGCDAACREVTESNCPYPGRDGQGAPEWVPDAACDPDPFAVACGVAACCTADGVCVDASRAECLESPPLAAPAYWHGELFCESADLHCSFPACHGSSSACSFVHDGAGCWNYEECVEICSLDAWCCEVEWDRGCVQLSLENGLADGEHAYCSDWPSVIEQPFEIDMNASYTFATSDVSEWLPTCFGGGDGNPCVSGELRLHNVNWFRFVASGESLRLSTCDSPAAEDTVFLVYGSPPSKDISCDALTMRAAILGDGCDGSGQACACFGEELSAGFTYYVAIGSRIPGERTIRQLDVTSPCSYEDCGGPVDCNHNRIPDWIDVFTGYVDDCNGNLIPDECDAVRGPDCNANQTPDECDLASMNSPDCNRNRVPDECDVAAETSPDCNQNAVPDECDLSSRTSLDCNHNRVPDECEPGDCDQNQILDICQADCDENGKADACDILSGAEGDCDEDLRFDVCQPPWEHMLPSFPGGWVLEPVLSSTFRGDVFAFCGADHKVTVASRHERFWTRELEFKIPIYSEYFDLGRSLVLLDDQLLVGAPAEWTGGNTANGAIHVLRRTGSGWTESQVLFATHPTDLGQFGSSMAAEAETLIVGSPTGGNGGEAYVFELENGRWAEQGRLQLPDQTPDGQFGASVSISGSFVTVTQVVGPADARGVHLFRRRGAAFEYFDSITLPTEVTGRVHAAVSGDLVLVGTPDVVTDGVARGAARMFQIRGLETSLVLEFPLVPCQRERGRSLALSADTAVLGADCGRGVYRRASEGWAEWLANVDTRLPIATDGVRVLSGKSLVRLGPSDCNGNSVTDACDGRKGESVDCNANLVPDECESLYPPDPDFDGDVDLRDFAEVQGCFTGGPVEAGPGCCRNFDDGGPEGMVSAGDYAAFYGALVGP